MSEGKILITEKGVRKRGQTPFSTTEELHQAGEIMQIRVLDHIIIGDKRYFSFVDKGLIRSRD